MMTMVIRPLGEILARIPAGWDYPGENAGASFEIDNPKFDEWPHLSEEDRLERYHQWLGELSEKAREFSELGDAILEPTAGQVVITAAVAVNGIAAFLWLVLSHSWKLSRHRAEMRSLLNAQSSSLGQR